MITEKRFRGLLDSSKDSRGKCDSTADEMLAAKIKMVVQCRASVARRWPYIEISLSDRTDSHQFDMHLPSGISEFSSVGPPPDRRYCMSHTQTWWRFDSNWHYHSLGISIVFEWIFKMKGIFFIIY